MHQHFQTVADRKWLAKLYYYHGFYCASHPGLVIFICGLLIFLCSAPIVNFSSLSTQTPSEWNESLYTNTTANHKPDWAKERPVASIQQIIVSIFVEPVNSSVVPDLVHKAFAPAYKIVKDVYEYRHRERNYGKSTTLSDHCFIINHHDPFLFSDEGKLLPRKGCLQISPINLWQDIDSFQKDVDVIAKIYRTPNKNVVGLKENIFGVPLQSIGLFPLNVTEKCLVIRYAITTVLNQYDKNFINGFTASLHSKYPSLVTTEYQEDAAQIVHIHYQGDNVIEIYHLCFTYVMVFVYVAFSVSKIEMVKSKLGLAISAVVTVVASLTMAAGLCIFFGMVPSVSSSEIFPYLVIIIGLENILVITRSIVSTPAYLPVALRVAEGLSKEGSSITLNLTSELLLLLCGYLTFVPGVQEFCMVGGVGVLTDFFLQIVFFSTVLSIDLSRLEPQNRHQKSPQVEIDVGNTFVSSISKDKIPTEDNVISERENHVDNLASKKAHSNSRALSRRVNFAYFWARTRIVQRGCMVFALLYILFVAVNSLVTTGVQETITETLNKTHSDTTWINNVSSNKEYIALKYSKRREIGGKNGGHRNSRKSFLSDCKRSMIPCVHWKEMTRFHWPRLLDLYGVNVMDRHISVLPPIRIQLMVDRQHLAKSELTLNDSLSVYYQDYSKKQRWTVGNYGVEFELVDFVKVLYIFTGIFIAVAMYLVYVLFTALPKPKRTTRKVGKKQIMPAAYPVFLEGHNQKIECIDCNKNVIASSCLQGVVRIWDCQSCECISILKKNRDCQIWTIKCWDTFLAAGCSNGDIEIWDYRLERLIFLYESNKSGITHILFVKESVLVGSRVDGSIDFIKVGNQLTQSNEQVSRSSGNHRTPANIKKRINPGLTTWELITNNILNDQYSCYTCCAHRKSISVLSCCKDLVISGSYDNLLKVFRAHSGVCLFTLRGHTTAVTAIDTDEQLRGVVSGSFSGQLLWWCLTSGECSKFSTGHFTTISTIVSTQSRIISLDISESLCIWDGASRTCLQTIPQGISHRCHRFILDIKYLGFHELPSGCLDLTILCSNIVVCVVMDALLMLDIDSGQILRIVEIEDKRERVFITRVERCNGQNAVVCDYGERLVVFSFVEIMEKLE